MAVKSPVKATYVTEIEKETKYEEKNQKKYQWLVLEDVYDV